ncbi:O-antigen translocase [Flavobacterium branchiophilum]|uniref:Putative lipopolysaccharide biosynthesis protein WzxE n=1 Tax=Flavobacterium branchiophilum (strain FL-15) TaxID=1034807 RepID=G2Z1G4_FLABF|nr:O-antigen translocase [Flavobacterium branchiophilum]CCB69732.1 Putative lipopolysaccharide biosynthesis protein WzxE [Flavobacterium branchiophilum FL-15]
MKIRHKILQSKLFKVTSLNSISVLIKIVIGIISSKILAVAVGASGMALIGNFRNFLNVIESISTFGTSNGIIKLAATHQKEDDKLKSILSTLLFSTIFLSIFLSFLLFFLANYIQNQIFGYPFDFISIIRVLALVLPLYALSIVMMAFLNGLGAFKKIIYLNMIGNVLGLVFTVYLVGNWHVYGGLLASIFAPTVLFFIAYYYLNQQINIIKSCKWTFFNSQLLINLLDFSLMSLVSAIGTPIVLLTLRNVVVLQIGLQYAGYWETMTRISNYYMMFITTILSLFFLPKLAAFPSNKDIKKTFMLYYKTLLPVFIIGSVFIYLFRFYIINGLFTSEFQPVENLFLGQLIGDVFKVASLILGYNLLAQKMTKTYIVTELVSLAVMYFSTLFAIQYFGFQGIVIGHCITFVSYFIVLLFVFRKIIFMKNI